MKSLATDEVTVVGILVDGQLEDQIQAKRDGRSCSGPDAILCRVRWPGG